jgi:hypothetical protein
VGQWTVAVVSVFGGIWGAVAVKYWEEGIAVPCEGMAGVLLQAGVG